MILMVYQAKPALYTDFNLEYSHTAEHFILVIVNTNKTVPHLIQKSV